MTRRRSKRRTVLYHLKRGSRIVYIGTTCDPTRRADQHRRDGKRFSHMLVRSHHITEARARTSEQQALKAYRHTHGGRLPCYNRSDTG